jgi:hypothetical protein
VSKDQHISVTPLDPQLVLESVLTCPHCGALSVENMPTDACIYFHECASCHTLLRPKAGDCCVFCSYGSVKCPPIQQSLLWCWWCSVPNVGDGVGVGDGANDCLLAWGGRGAHRLDRGALTGGKV